MSEASGLVLSSTSGTKPAGLKANRRLGRARRLRRVCLTAYNQLREAAEFRGYRGRWAFVTLTYAQPGAWQPGHVTAFQQAVRKHLSRRGLKLRMIWVAELTKAGRVHYHAMIWLPRGTRLPKPDAQGWWGHGMSNIKAAHAPAGYLAKYVSKGCDGLGSFPKGCRTYAVLGLDARQRMHVRFWAAPAWVREHFVTADQDVRPAAGGGFYSRVTGEHRESPWVVILLGPEVLLLPKGSTRPQDERGQAPEFPHVMLNKVQARPDEWRARAQLARVEPTF